MLEKFKSSEIPNNHQEEFDQELLDFCKNNREVAKKIQIIRSKYEYEWWKSNNPIEVAWGQLNEPCLIMDFDKFHEAVEKALNRQVNIHELRLNAGGIKEELQEKQPTLFLKKTIKITPEEKRIVIELPEKDEEKIKPAN